MALSPDSRDGVVHNGCTKGTDGRKGAMRRVDELAKKEKAHILKEIRSQRMVKTRGMGARFCPDVQTSRRPDGHCPMSRQADVWRHPRGDRGVKATMLRRFSSLPTTRPYSQIGRSPPPATVRTRDSRHLRKGVKFTVTQHEMPQTKHTRVVYIGVSVGCTS